MHTRDSRIARNGCRQNEPSPLAFAAPSSPTAAEATAGLVVLGCTTGGRVVRLPLPNRQRGAGLATSTATVAAASTATAASSTAILSSVDDYLSVVDFPGAGAAALVVLSTRRWRCWSGTSSS